MRKVNLAVRRDARITLAFLRCGVGLACCYGASAHALEHEIAWGGAYSEGYYGRDSVTRVTQSPIAYTVRHAAWRAKLALTWLAVDGAREDVSVYAIKHATGWADGNFLLEHAYSPNALWRITLAAQLKFPLSGYTRGLSTGTFDGSMQTSAYYAATQNISVFGQVAYWWRGDPPALDLENRAHLVLGTYGRINTMFASGVTIERLGAATHASVAQVYNAFFLATTISPRWRIIPYFIKGYTSSAPTWGAGLEMQYRFSSPAVGGAI